MFWWNASLGHLKVEQQTPVAQHHDSCDSSDDYKWPVTANETISFNTAISLYAWSHMKSNRNTLAHHDSSCSVYNSLPKQMDTLLAHANKGLLSKGAARINKAWKFLIVTFCCGAPWLFVCSLLNRLKILGFTESHKLPLIKCPSPWWAATARKSSCLVKQIKWMSYKVFLSDLCVNWHQVLLRPDLFQHVTCQSLLFLYE